MPILFSMHHVFLADLLDLSASMIGTVVDPESYPWLAIPLIGSVVRAMIDNPPPGYRLFARGILVGEGCAISSRAELIGPAVIGPGTEIRTGALIRENVLVGNSCLVGNSSELKNCVLFDQAQAPHFNYVGDSIMGKGSHIGAGVILSNLKSDKSEVHVRNHALKAERFDLATSLVKFGAILGDGVEIGCNSVCYPGTIIGRSTVVYPLSAVRGIVPADSILKADGTVAERRAERRKDTVHD
jgi:UDP-N-acetylglucosamine diphosphorylase / glucose-1-phosphate thymidylyltransferase / UDP-N-acetylgalactosamine diphosphorylase / glucosamine-1-phosphate N-acetyltransferase / galactosamine-1-phosphate N-acetyltransferase